MSLLLFYSNVAMQFLKFNLKEELGVLEFYFRKIPLHQQKFFVFRGLGFSNSPWLPRIWKMDQNEVSKHFSVGNTFCQATIHARIFCLCCAM